ncbi:T9SS type A sorting domain-containing protein [Taibaiella chishuiensis]|uniref:Putative secreted protein (Por secretion system target) n=1 Tax=Taibaiella chishuiensis TaxID=1434707 RepID=A0A2P8D2H2_9BACT|nr:T9SS type A sorting domain-containing protein [Taibaiella chishuiensis]PSK91418.1 putative secreted protein (Por secretion system target) [Taibaiella chishuiensis]
MKKRKFTLFRALLLLGIFCTAFGNADAQTTMQAGDIAFTGYNCNNSGALPNQVSFVILRTGGISSGTQLHLTDNGFNKESQALQVANGEGDILITFNTALPQFTEVYVKASANGLAIDACTYKNSSGVFVSTNITASVQSGEFILSQAGDQVFAFQGSLATPTFISGIHMNSEVVGALSQPASTAAGWDVTANANGATGWSTSQSRSAIPNALVNGTTAIMVVTAPGTANAEKDNATFNCSAAVGSSAADLRSKLNNVTNWTSQDVLPYTVPTNCTYIVSAPPSVTGHPSNATTCAGSGATFQVVASNATGYQWQVLIPGGGSYSDIINSTTYAGATTATLTLSNITAGMNGYSYRCVVSGNVTPNATSNAATLTVTAPGTWLGAVSTAWSNTANWSCGVLPTATIDITISSTAVRMPLVDIAGAICNNLTLGAGATLAFSGSANALEVKGNFTNSGTFDPSLGKLILSGAAQSVPAVNYKDLQITGGNSKTLSGATAINGVLTLTNGLLVLGSNNLTVNATGSIAGGTSAAFIVTNGTGSLTQNNIGTGGRAGTVIFPVGSDVSSFTRAALSNSGTADNFTIKVSQGVFNSYTGTTGSGAITQDYVNKTWFINEGTAGGSNVNLTLEWNGLDQLSGFNGNNCQIAHFNGTTWVSTGTPGFASGLDPYTISRSGLTQFSPFSVTSSAPLPLQLLSFTGKRNNSDVLLQWKATAEKSISTYELERSADSRVFTPVGSVAAQRQGTSEVHTYNYTDAGAFKQGDTWYYRLRIVHEDGSALYSRTLQLNGNAGAQDLVVYPNPVHGSVLNIRWNNATDETAALTVSDLMGRVQLKQTVQTTGYNMPVQLNTATLAPGTYLLRISSAVSGQTSTLRFTKR